MNQKLKFTIAIIFIMLVIAGCNFKKEISANGIKSINRFDYGVDTEERYIANMAYNEGMTFEEAKKINDLEIDLLIEEMNQEVEIRYKTIDKKAGIIENNVEEHNVFIGTELRYFWNNIEEKPAKIESIGYPTLYLENFNITEVNGGEFNIEKYSTTGRISKTAILRYSVSSSLGISKGLDIEEVSPEKRGLVAITAENKTYFINIDLSELLK